MHGPAFVAAVPDAEQLLGAVDAHRPDVVVVDVRMPPTHTDEGIRAALVIRRQHPDVAVCVLSQYMEVLRLMAEGRSSTGITEALRVSHSAVEKYVSNIFTKLDLPPTDTDHRRVLAVLRYLGA
ncbi:response regulator transcription factor [Krasilnikovia sp. MM14-A1004]|uniref:response regulator transcription factor n=1 Tax=Krasilnikovia sp. MM14-A1004 TaxID=3373541 RepID=UPI00399C6FB3